MKPINKILDPIKKPENLVFNNNTDDIPVIYLPRDGSYVEILGHRIDGDFKSFDGFCKYLDKIKQTEINNEILKAEKELLENKIHQIEYYVDLKLEEAKLDRQYVDGQIFASQAENIYEKVLDKIREIKGEKDDRKS